MHTNFTKEEENFEREVRIFFKDKYPSDIKQKQDQAIPLLKEDFIRWQKVLFAQGWAAINWPVEYGGTGWSTVQKYIFISCKYISHTHISEFAN